MKYTFLISGLFLVSCGQSPEHTKENPEERIMYRKDQKQITGSLPVQLNLVDLQEKVFEIGNEAYITDSCAFYFRCDCCSGEIFFNSDSTFYHKDYCMSDQTLMFGHYAIKENMVFLYYSGICISKDYNWENEIDTSAVDYFMRDTLVKASTFIYFPETCGNKLKLVEKEKVNSAIQAGAEYEASINRLRKQGYMERLKKLSK